ncbi:MAG TPA: MarR family transcriptional regulator [Solirubrobacterales bacterium]|jgi:DNA-binding MarR family transcriptional regulator|nr:MarR family transcriptional regulator [Solirubrobacterales bacterium]
MPRSGSNPSALRLDSLPTWLLSRSSGQAHRLLADAFAAAGARGYHYRVLAALEDLGPASQATVGRRAEMDRSDVVAALNELEADDLVERAPDPDDGRQKIVSITAAGRRHLKKLDEVVASVQDELLAPLSAAERAELVRLLSRIAGRSS